MRTSLIYTEGKKSVWNDTEEKWETIVASKGFDFFVHKASDAKEHSDAIMSFITVLREESVPFDWFGDGTWHSHWVLGDTENYEWVSIPIHDASEKAKVHRIYETWKEATEWNIAQN